MTDNPLGHHSQSHHSATPTTTALNLFRANRPVLVFIWACHFAASILVMVWGSWYWDEERKYIPVDANGVATAIGNNAQCSKAYANVLASEMEEDGATICCPTQRDSRGGICDSIPWYLPIARRLTKLPEAWLIPLFPLLIRAVVQFLSRQRTPPASDDGTALKRQKEINTLAIRRLLLYFGLMQLRGFILYLLFDAIEDQIVGSGGDACWYDGVLRSFQSVCKGRATDFSDHVVLVFAQLLPIPLTEVLFSFVAPFWRDRGRYGRVAPTLLVTGLVYIYGICFLGTYKTAAHFHTQLEIILGYLISLVVQIPLFLVLCTSYLVPARDYFFGRGM
mmetsp:Transcript_9499/g.23062  ORF Transcript_9499/g.23062 Transcript_9499/m.23062 type:complete len:335 (-) Transcript_9499:916-1920(-)